MPSTSSRSKCSGRHRDVAGRDGREVRPRLLVVAGDRAVHPVAPPGVALLVDELELVAEDALAQPADLDAVGVGGRGVDVQERALGHRHALQLLHDARDEPRALVERELLPEPEVHLPGRGLLGQRDGRQAEQDALQRRGDRAGVGDVVAEVRAVVGAGDDHLGLEPVDEAGRRQAHAVDGRAVRRVADRPVAEVDLLDPQRPPGGDRAAGRRAVAVGGDHHQLDAGDLQQLPAQDLEALGLQAVVVREQDPHPPESTNQRISGRGAT